MPPHTTSLLTLGLLFLATAGALVMLEAQGRLKAAKQPKILTLLHRVCGYAFALLFAGLWAIMIYRTRGYRLEFSPRILLHIALAAGMASMLGLKILISRRYRRYFAYLPAIGGLLLTGAVVTATITAGLYFLKQTSRFPEELTQKRGPSASTPARPDTDSVAVETLVRQKCAHCHPLDRLYLKKRTPPEWGKLVDRMIENAEEIGEVDFLTPAQKEVLVDYLAKR